MRRVNKNLKLFGLIATLLALGTLLPGCQQWLRVGFKAEAPVDSNSPAQQKARRRKIYSSTEMRGLWVSNVDSTVMDSFGNMESLAARVSNLNLNTLYPVVWNKGETFYPSTVMERFGAQKISSRYGLPAGNRDPMNDWLILGNQYDLDIVPWFEWGVKVPANSPLATQHPQWLSKDVNGKTTFDQDGTTTAYLNFIHPEVQAFYEQLLVEFVARYNVPAVQFDDHMSLKNVFGYDDFTLELYRKQTGRSAKPAPEAPEWLAWRAGQLSQFVARVSRAIKAARPGVKFSVSPNPYPWSYQNYVQDWPAWVDAGWVDEVVLQVYRTDISRFQGELNSPVLARVKGKTNIHIGILAGLKPEPMPVEMLRAQTAMVREFGFQGVVYFFQESLLQFTAPGETIEGRLNAIKQLFPSPARTP
ncbi:glycoside hydrolase family 10 protein [bacterium]|nr:glycoside hydrolase family 10 protein [bacterium]